MQTVQVALYKSKSVSIEVGIIAIEEGYPEILSPTLIGIVSRNIIAHAS